MCWVAIAFPIEHAIPVEVAFVWAVNFSFEFTQFLVIGTSHLNIGFSDQQFYFFKWLITLYYLISYGDLVIIVDALSFITRSLSKTVYYEIDASRFNGKYAFKSQVETSIWVGAFILGDFSVYTFTKL